MACKVYYGWLQALYIRFEYVDLVMELRPGFFKVRIPDWVRTLRWITRFFPDPLFEDFHKLSVEKEILKIGQDLTELDVNATLAEY